MTDDGPAPSELLALAEDVAVRAGALVERTRLEAVASHDTKSSLTDLVTEADRAAERAIIEGVLAARPLDGILGEEGGERAGTSGVRWIVDPIDGTTNYVYDLPAYAVSIAAERAGVVVAGVVHDPRAGVTYAAHAGGGATRNGHPVRCSSLVDLATALVGTGFSYDAGRRRTQAELLLGVLPHVRDIRRMGSAALDLCAVATGTLDAYYEHGLNPWDLAAGWLIASEAGASVGDLEGGPPSPRCVVAAAPGLFPGLVDLLVAAGGLDLT